MLKLKSRNDPIDHEKSFQWLQETAESLIEKTLVADTTSGDSVYKMHWGFLHLGFLYLDLQNAIHWENGPQIIHTGNFGYLVSLVQGERTESINLVAKLDADLP